MANLEDVHKDALARFSKAEEYEREDRLLQEEDLAFLAGEQWNETVRNERERTDRPVLTFNRLPQFIEQVVGDARQNKPAIKVHPVDEGSDPDTAEIHEGLIRNIESQSRAPEAYITALTHACGGGRGAWRVVTEYVSDDSFAQDIKIKRILNPFAVYFDPSAREYSCQDANWCFVVEWITREAFEAKWPDKSPKEWEATYKRIGSIKNWLSDDRVRLAEYWVKEPVTKELYLLSNGTTVEDADPEALAFHGLSIVRSRKVKSHKVVRYLLSGHEILEGPQEFPSRYIPIVPCFGPEEFIGDRVRHRSLIRYAKDPQQMYNFWQTAIAEKIALAPKAPYIGTLAMFEGLEKFWNEANRANRPYLPFNPDPNTPGLSPRREQPAAVNTAEIQQAAQAIDDLKATMGMYDASLGAQGNETSGRAILARQREGDAATFAWIDNLARSIEHTGRILVDMIPRVYDTQRIVRVLGEDDAVDLVKVNVAEIAPDGSTQMINDLTTGKYDVAITVGPSYATKRLEAAESMLAFVQALPQAGQVAGDLIAKAMDWPGAEEIGERLKMLLPPGMIDDDDPQSIIAQLSQQLQEMGMQTEQMAQELQKHNDAETEYKTQQAYKTLQDGISQEIKNEAVRTGIAPLDIL